MVCLPCIVIPIVLWIFHRYIRPILGLFFEKYKAKPQINDAGDKPIAKPECVVDSTTGEDVK